MNKIKENKKLLYVTPKNKNKEISQSLSKLVYVDSEDFSKEIERHMSYESYYGNDNYY